LVGNQGRLQLLGHFGQLEWLVEMEVTPVWEVGACLLAAEVEVVWGGWFVEELVCGELTTVWEASHLVEGRVGQAWPL